MDDVISVERRPELRDPVLVYAFSGWVDAGHAGAGTIAALAETLEASRRFATLDCTGLLDLQQVRPTVRIDDGGLRRIEWPHMEFVAGRSGRDVVLALGPEPSIRWSEVAGAIVDLARDLGVTDAVAVGGMPALVSHHRPVPVLATATSREVAGELGPLRPDYEGPTGFQTALQERLGAAGIRSIALWAQVPQYVAGSMSPPAVRAVLARLAELTRISVELASHDERCADYAARLEEGLADRPDVADLVHRLDDEGEQMVGDATSARELVTEIESFLRSQSDPG